MEDHQQQALFNKAFNYVIAKEGKMDLGAAICCFENKAIETDDKFAVGWAILSMLHQRKDEFDAIRPGLTNQMKEKIVTDMC